MLGASTFAEHSIANQGILLFDSATMSGLSSSANVGVGVMSGVATMDSNFTATTAGIYISGSTNAEMSFSGSFSNPTGLLVNLGVSSMESAFTETSNGIMIGSGVSTQDLNMTQTTTGDLMFIEINSGLTSSGRPRPGGAPTYGSGYTTITPSGIESYTTITPSGSETWTEV